jgi:hypothetical protein
VRAALLYVALGAVVVAAAVAVSVVLLSSTRGDKRIGRLSPVARLPATSAPVTVPAPASTVREHDGRGESDD